MSKADCIVQKAPGYIGMPYYLGEEGRYVAGVAQTAAIDIDCSGLAWSLWLDCDVLLNGKHPARLTADGYFRLATPIFAPSIPGKDCCWFPKSGPKTHIAIYIGDGKTIEAGNHGPGGSYPGHGYVGTCTVAQMNARGCVWGRITGLDFEDSETEEDMAIDKVSPATVQPYLDRLVRAGIIDSPTKHPIDDAASVGLLLVALGRMLDKVESAGK